MEEFRLMGRPFSGVSETTRPSLSDEVKQRLARPHHTTVALKTTENIEVARRANSTPSAKKINGNDPSFANAEGLMGHLKFEFLICAETVEDVENFERVLRFPKYLDD